MANQIVNRQVNIFIESGQAQKALDTLIKKENDLKAALDKATDPKKAAQLKTELDRLQEPIDRARKKLAGELAPSFRDVQKTVNDLGNRLKRMSEEDADYSAIVAQYREANNQLTQQKQKVGILGSALRSFWQEAKTVAVGVIVGNTIQTMLQTVLGYVTGIVTGSAKISDQLADIQRVTGLTTSEVKQLNSELKKIDTRTSASDLRDMAITAGKLGVAKNDILEFVAATDKLHVALGDELGDVDQITTQLGKILNVFKGEITAADLTHLGNAFVDLANKGVATGAFMADFTQRVSGIAKTSNLSLGAVLGLAAGIEETGGEAESGSTAIQKLLITIAQDLPKAAKIAGAKTAEEVKAFTDLFAKSPQEALLQYAQGLQKNSSSFAELVAQFKDAGQEGARVIQTVTKLGSSTDLFRKKINDATEALKSNGEIEEAFKLKNESLGGAVDRLKKNFASLFTSSSFQEGAQSAVKVLNAFVDLIKGSLKFIGDHKILIASLATVYTLATTSIKATSIATIFNNTVTAISSGISKAAAAAATLYRIVMITLTRQVTAATGAQLAWNTITSLGAGPLGILLVAVGALVIGIEKLTSNSKQLTAQQRVQAELSQRVAEATTDTVTKVKTLVAVIEDEKTSLQAKKKAYEELIAINPEFAKTLTLDAQGHLQGKDAIDKYIHSLEKKAQAEANYSLYVEKLKERQQAQNDLAKKEKALPSTTVGQVGAAVVDIFGAGVYASYDKAKQKVKDLDDEIAQLKVDTETTTRQTLENGGNAFTETFDIANASLAELQKKLKELKAQLNPQNKDTIQPQIIAIQKRIKELLGQKTPGENKVANDIKELREELEKLATSLLPEDTLKQQLQKELQAADDKYAKLVEKAHGNAKLLEQIETLHQLERKKIIDKYFGEEQRLFNEALKNEKDRNAIAEEALRQKFAPLLNKALQKLQSEGDARDQDILLKDQLAVVEKAGAAKRDAEIKLVDDQLRIEREKKQKELDALGKDEVAKRQLILDQINQMEDDARAKRKQAEIDYWQGIIDFAKQGLDIFNTFSEIKNNKENADLQRDKSINDKKKANLDKRLKAGLISQEQYDREVQKIEAKQQAREKEIRTKQFKREQKAAIAQTLISAAEGAIKLWANPGFPAAIPLAAILALETGLKIGAIASQKPPEYGRGGFLYGKSHAEGGMGVYDHYGRKQAELEGGEGIGSKKTMSDRRVYNVTGTPSQIYSLLNGVNGGVQWSSGAVLRPGWSTQKPMPMNFAAVRRFYAAGGQFDSNNNPVNNAGSSQEMLQMLAHMIATNENLNKTLADIKANGINGNVYLNDIEKQQARKANLLKEAGNG